MEKSMPKQHKNWNYQVVRVFSGPFQGPSRRIQGDLFGLAIMEVSKAEEKPRAQLAA